ncbi:GNAT family N-acetyltransferase [Nocardioides sp. TF02-7]|uniref:GNAT family N-acetyltransferase n=1 Tax=Nocardioides sp. TF02-7 TaxID=2917724 RepID=UPI001F06A66C|nr:GNAT family N-acetyltransferase [Nocardioides sp. TF02-7]UMG91752.1 GNAT family N-acetyltransferase [Nocardioides sp. TF02-7]
MSAVELPDGLRPATPDDVPEVLRLIRDLATYEREPDAVRNTPERLHAALFGGDPVASALVAEVDGAVVGTAIWFRTYSTWTGVAGLHLEDLYVDPAHRARGLGRAFFTALARIAVARGYARFEWVVLDWNESAIGFYDALGGRRLDDWLTYRVEGDRLRELADR